MEQIQDLSEYYGFSDIDVVINDDVVKNDDIFSDDDGGLLRRLWL